MNQENNLDIWIELVQENYPGLSTEQYYQMKNSAAIHYYFGSDYLNWNSNNEYSKLFERFLILRNLKK